MITSIVTKIKRKIYKKYIKNNYTYWSNLDSNKYKNELSIWFQYITGNKLDLENPKSFNEKIQWMKLYDSTPLKTRLADKYLVREWVKQKVGEQYLIPLLGVYDSFDSIDFNKLPDQFVLKCNHGSGWNLIVKDKKNFDWLSAKKAFDAWMKMNYAFMHGLELHYLNIKPRIVAEKFIASLNEVRYEYKFFCFNGEPVHVWVNADCKSENQRRNIYDLNWVDQKFKVGFPNIEPPPERPETFKEMCMLAKKLCEGFAFVRVDFYSEKGKVYFGEMTFTPTSGIAQFDEESKNLMYGNFLQLPSKSPMPQNLEV